MLQPQRKQEGKTNHNMEKKNEFSTEDLLSNLQSHSIRGAKITMAAQGLKLLIQIFSITVLARLLEPSDFGVVAMATIFTGLLTVFKDGGLSMATIQKDEITHAQVSNLFWINTSFGLALTVMTTIVSPLAALLFSEPRLTMVCIAIGLSFTISGLAVQHEAILRRQMKFTTLAMVDVTAMATGTLATIIAAWYGAGYWSLVAMPLIISITQSILYWTKCNWRPSGIKKGTGVRPLLRFGANLTGANLIGYLASNITPFFVGTLGGSHHLGLYSRANTLVSIPSTQLLIPVMNVAQPGLARIATDRERLRRTAISLLRKIGIASVFIAISIQVMADWIVLAFLGTNWMEATNYLRILAVFAIVEPLMAAIAMILIASGHAAPLLKLKIISLVLVGSSVLIGSHWGAIGVTISFAATGLIIRTPIFIWMACRHLPFRQSEFYYALLPIFLVGAVTGLLLLGARQYTNELSAISGIAIYTALTFAMYLSGCMANKYTRNECINLFGHLKMFNPRKI